MGRKPESTQDPLLVVSSPLPSHSPLLQRHHCFKRTKDSMSASACQADRELRKEQVSRPEHKEGFRRQTEESSQVVTTGAFQTRSPC